jgi:hypothetical protein
VLEPVDPADVLAQLAMAAAAAANRPAIVRRRERPRWWGLRCMASSYNKNHSHF